MSKLDCIWKPTVRVGNEVLESTLYTKLYEKLNGDRNAVLYAYVAYTQPGVAEAMDAKNYKRDAVGLHHVDDVLEYLAFKELFIQNTTDADKIAVAYGVADNTSPITPTNFKSGVEALKAAIKINEDSKGSFVANVTKIGNNYNVIVDRKNAKTAGDLLRTESLLKAWNFTLNQLTKINPNLKLEYLEESMPTGFDILNPNGFLTYLRGLTGTNQRYFTKYDIQTILALSEHHVPSSNTFNVLKERVERRNNLTSATIADIAEDIYGVYHTPNISSTLPGLVRHYDTALKSLVENMLFDAFFEKDPVTVIDDLGREISNFQMNSPESNIIDEIDQLRKNYKIDADIVKVSETISSIQDILKEEIFSLKRLLDSYRDKHKDDAFTEAVLNNIEALFDELRAKEFKSGSLEFMNLGLLLMKQIEANLKTIDINSYNDFVGLQIACDILAQALNFAYAYQRIAQSLIDIDSKLMDINITDFDKEQIKEVAQKLNTTISKWTGKDGTLAKKREKIVEGLCKEVLGDTFGNAIAVMNVIRMCDVDGSAFDYLYSVGRQSNSLISIWGSILQDAKHRQTTLLTEFSRKIRGYRNALKKAGESQDDSFMYSLNSSIDWQLYNADKRSVYNSLRNSGYSGEALKQAVLQWEDNNTRLITSNVNGQTTTKRVPNEKYITKTDLYYIVSDIDWHAYHLARSAAYHILKNQGLLGVPLLLAILLWEKENLESRVIYREGNEEWTEMVPNGNYRLNNGFYYDNGSVKMRIDLNKTGWSKALADYYNNMMSLKAYLLTISPTYAQHLYRPPYIRKDSLDVLTDAKKYGYKKTFNTLLNRLRDFYRISEDDDNYAKNGLIFNEDEGVVARSTFDNTILRRIPIFYRLRIKPVTNEKGEQIGQDEILLDFATSLQHYAATIFGYSEINNIKNILELLGEYIQNKAGKERKFGYDMIDVVENKDTYLIKDLAKRGPEVTSNLIRGFINRDIYGEKSVNDGSWDKIARNLVSYASLKMLAANLKGGTANLLQGKILLLIEAAAGDRFNFRDYVKGEAYLIRLLEDVLESLTDDFTHNRNTNASLLIEFFDPRMSTLDELHHHRYHSNIVRTTLGLINPFFLYGMGEYAIHIPTMYAILNHQKVLKDGEKVALLDCFTYNDGENGTRYLGIADNVTTLDGEPIDMDSEYLQTVRRLIKETNLNMHGSMNDEDKGLIHRYTLGKMAMSLRQWMVEHYSRRYRGKHISADTRDIEEGYNTTFYKFLADLAKRAYTVIKALGRDYTAAEAKLLESVMRYHAKNKFLTQMSEKEKANIRRATMELSIYSSLIGLGWVLGSPEDHKKEWLKRFLIYEQKRMLTDVQGALPWGVWYEGKNVKKSPFSVIPVINGLAYPIVGGLIQGEFWEDFESGSRVGKNKGWEKTKQYTVPFIYQIESLLRLDEDDLQYSIFDSDRKWSGY